jgi:uncharacterized protein (TIGR02391 family)
LSTQIPQLNRSALEEVSKNIGDRYTGTEITAFFHKAGFANVSFDGSTKWRFVFSVLEQIQSGSSGNVHIAKILETLCSPQEFFGKPEAHAQIVERIDEIVSFYGLQVDPKTGKLLLAEESRAGLHQRKSMEAQAFDARKLHPEVIKHGRELFVQGKHFHAVFECCKAFDRFVANKAQIDDHGDKLMGAALSANGTLKLNSQRTQTELNEQEGIMHLGKGLMRAIRNPEAHEPQLDWTITQQDALDILSLVSFLYRKIETAIYFKQK